MTSVQNRLQQLSGSKLFLILIVAFSLQSCSVFEDIFGGSKSPEPPPPVEESEEPVEEVPTDEEVDLPDLEEEEDTIIIKDPIEVKDQINVAVILPFQLNQLDQNGQYTSASESSFQIYKGIRYALENITLDDAELNLYVFDNNKSESETRKILEQDPFPDVHAVIGPLYTSNIQVVADYAKENEIYFISPLSSSESMAKDNEYIISANATKETRYRLLFDYISKEFVNPNIGIIYQPISKEMQVKDNVIKVADEMKISINERKSEGRQMFAVVEQLLERGRENVIIVPADDNSEGELYLDRLLMYLQGISSAYDIHVVGLEEWNGRKNIAPAKYPDVNFFVLDRYFIDDENLDISNQISDLQNQNKGVPLHIYTLQGYDLMSYLGELMTDHGIKFPKRISRKSFAGLQTRYEFDDLEVNNEDLFLENKYINILQFRNGKWQRVN